MVKEETLKTKVTAFLKLVGKRRLWIQTHDVPDPDAIASAEALRVIARHFGVRAQIVAKGFPHRRENKALIRECKIPLKPLESVKIQSVSRTAWAFIDCLPDGGNVTLHPRAPGNLFLAIDHHGKPGNSLKNNSGAYVITDRSAGATATMLGMLLLGLDVPFAPRLASALSYAIISDTLDFSRGASQTDLDVYTILFPFTNQKIISRLRTATKSQMYFRTLHRALANASFYRHVSWVWIGEVKSGEDVAEMADLILSCERITWSLALGYAGDRLYLSIRSSQPKARCARIIHRLVPESWGTVGGHDMFAGGYIYLKDTSNPDEIADYLIKRFIRLILRIPKSAEDPVGTLFVGG